MKEVGEQKQKLLQRAVCLFNATIRSSPPGMHYLQYSNNDCISLFSNNRSCHFFLLTLSSYWRKVLNSEKCSFLVAELSVTPRQDISYPIPIREERTGGNAVSCISDSRRHFFQSAPLPFRPCVSTDASRSHRLHPIHPTRRRRPRFPDRIPRYGKC